MKKRIDWIDQVKGFGIFLVVYGHNFPVIEPYIYSFHMPLFFIIAGFFHPKEFNYFTIKKRVMALLIPYFLWSGLLFLFWVFLGRFYGESTNYDLSVVDNLVGIFYAQGGRSYMDWGIPMWFIPTIFLSFMIFGWINRIKEKYIKFLLLLASIIVGFLLSIFFDVKYIWSFDVALVAISFYAFGFFIIDFLKKISNKNAWILFTFLGIVHFVLFSFNSKIDMYRSEYGNIGLFLTNGIIGSLFYLLLFRNIPKFKFFSFLGKFTIPILALQIRALTLIKLFLLVLFSKHAFSFSEPEKFFYSIVQIVLIVPVLYLINKYLPVLNGSPKKI